MLVFDNSSNLRCGYPSECKGGDAVTHGDKDAPVYRYNWGITTVARSCAGGSEDWSSYTLAGLARESGWLRNTPSPSLGLLGRLERLEAEIAVRWRDVPVPIKPPSLTVVAHQIVWLDEADFYAHHGDAHLYSDGHYQSDEVLDWARDRHYKYSVRLASQASRTVLHDHICRVTGVAPEFLHIQGGVTTLDDGRQILEARLPCWADPMGRGRNQDSVAREIESTTYADFRRWLARFAEGAILGWTGKRYDCVMHRYYRQRTGVRWDCLWIDLDTATVESESSYATATAILPSFAEYVSHITTINVEDALANDGPITAGWLRDQLPADWPDPQPL